MGRPYVFRDVRWHLATELSTAELRVPWTGTGLTAPRARFISKRYCRLASARAVATRGPVWWSDHMSLRPATAAVGRFRWSAPGQLLGSTATLQDDIMGFPDARARVEMLLVTAGVPGLGGALFGLRRLMFLLFYKVDQKMFGRHG